MVCILWRSRPLFVLSYFPKGNMKFGEDRRKIARYVDRFLKHGLQFEDAPRHNNRSYISPSQEIA